MQMHVNVMKRNKSTWDYARIDMWTYVAKTLVELQVSEGKKRRRIKIIIGRQTHECCCWCREICTVEGGTVCINWFQDSITKAWSGHNDKLTAESVRGRWLLYSQQRRGEEEEKKREERIVRMWQRSSNLETLGGRERSLRGLYVSEWERERDHRPIAAQWQEPPRGDKDTCDFSSRCQWRDTGRRRFTREHGGTRIWASLRHILISERDTTYADVHIKERFHNMMS